MPDARGARFAFEAGFLLALAAVLAVARVEPLWIVAVMVVAWLIVALVEWVAWRGEPHWASGQPPRYYVPQQPLPPRPPTQELPSFSLYPQPPAPRDDAPTWIATPEMRQELLGWPSVEPAQAEEPEPRLEPAAEPLSEELLAEAAVVAAPEQEAIGWGDDDGGWPHAEPWELEPEPELEEPEPEPVPVPAPVEPEPEREPEPVFVAPAPEPEREPAPEPAAEAAVAEPEAVAAPVAAVGVRPRELLLARHRLDPFGEAAGRRRWSRRTEQPPDAELPSLPHHARIHPSATNGDGA